jgi:polyhydroxybutyrate depolymerase
VTQKQRIRPDGKSRARLVCLVCLVCITCTRANLDVVTRGASHDGGDGDGGDGDGGDGGNLQAVTCPALALQAGDTTETIASNGVSRSYVLHVPSAYGGSKPVPLILDFHFLASSGSIARSISPYLPQTDPEGVIMAFPNGLAGPSGAAWNFGPCCVAEVDDIAFVKAVVADIKTKACVDAKRVYAVGSSMGGGMAYYVGCRAADQFAAVATAAWDLLQENVADCQPTRAISVLSFRSTGDTLVPYAGGASSVVPGMAITFLGAKATFQKWAAVDRCTGTASMEDSNGCSSYAGCKDGVEVELCTKQGGNQDAANASIAWPLLKRHALP